MLRAKETVVMRRRTSSVASLAILLLTAVSLFADDPASGTLVLTRRYDVSELLARARADGTSDPADRPLGPDDRIGGLTQTVSENRVNFVRFICETIDPPSWRDAGGSFEIALKRDVLVVTQTAENHAGLVRLLAQAKGDASDRAREKFEAAVVPELALRDAPLAEALATLSRDAGGLAVMVDWAAVRAIGLTPQTRVTFAGARLRAPVALHAILRAAGAGPDAALEFTYTSRSVVVAPEPPRPATEAGTKTYVLTLRYLPARAAGPMAGSAKAARADVIDALLKRLGGEFPDVKFRDVDATLVVMASPSDYYRLRARLYDLESGVAK
jgi:hypothetical protein